MSNADCGKLRKAIDKGTQLELPTLVYACSVCKGMGQYEQSYNAGCGFGMYRSMGPCDFCQSTGFRYHNGTPIPKSVLNQIIVTNSDTIEIANIDSDAISLVCQNERILYGFIDDESLERVRQKVVELVTIPFTVNIVDQTDQEVTFHFAFPLTERTYFLSIKVVYRDWHIL